MSAIRESLSLLPYVVAVLLNLGIGLYALRRREAAGSLSFALYSFCMAQWSLGYILELAATSLAGKLTWDAVQFVGSGLAPVAMLFVARSHVGMPFRRPAAAAALVSAIPACGIAAALVGPLRPLIYRDPVIVAAPPFGELGYAYTPSMWFFMAYSLAVGAWAIGILARHGWSHRGPLASQSRWITAALLLPLVGAGFALTGTRLLGHRDSLPLFTLVANVIILVALFRQRLFGVIPIARELVVDTMLDGVLVFDARDRLADINQPGRDLVHRLGGRAAVGRTPLELFPAQAPGRELGTLMQEAPPGRHESVWRDGAEGEVLELHVTPCTSRFGQQVGRIVMVRDITAQARARDALERQSTLSERRFRALFENAGDAILLMDQERFVDGNQKALELFRCTREELIGETPFRFSPQLQPDGRASRDKAMERIEAAVAGSPQFFEWLHARLDGSQFLAEVSLNAVMLDQKAFLQAIVRDITDRRRMEEALRESAETFRALSENSQDVIIRFDREGRHLYVNAMAERRTGVPVAAHIGRTPAELGFPPALCDLWLDAIGEVVRRRSVHRVEYEFPQGSWIDWLLVPEFDADGEVNAVMTSARDFTERKLAEEDKAALERQLQHAQKMEVVGQLAGGVAHDFNNLLFVILGYLEILQPAVEGDPELTAGLQEISLAAERAAVLTRQLLAFSRKQAIKIVPLDLNEVVSQMLPMYDRVLSENISLQARLTGSLPKVMGDKGQIEQMLMNLVVNARDALPEGGHITVGTGTETLDAANCGKRMDVSPGAYAVLTISDDGSGMSRDVQERIFEPFFTTKPLGAGTGLGLSMVFGMMKQHGGHIEVDSERGRGSTFKLLFPALPASTGGHDSQESPGEPDLPGGDELLALVEDNAAVRVLGVRMLSQLGYRVLDYGSGEEALEALQGRAPSPDLLITDVMLTGLTGGVLAQRLKAVHPGLKVLFISGYPENILPVHGRVVGDTQLLLKPFAIGDLGRRVRAILDAD